MGLSPASWRLAKLSRALRESGRLSKRNEVVQVSSGRRAARIILVVVFICLLAVPVVMRRIAARRERVNNSLDTSAALSRYGFHFEEVVKTSGVNFTHQAPTLDHRLDHIMPQVASMGAAVSVVDFNRDGW